MLGLSPGQPGRRGRPSENLLAIQRYQERVQFSSGSGHCEAVRVGPTQLHRPPRCDGREGTWTIDTETNRMASAALYGHDAGRVLAEPEQRDHTHVRQRSVEADAQLGRPDVDGYPGVVVFTRRDVQPGAAS